MIANNIHLKQNWTLLWEKCRFLWNKKRFQDNVEYLLLWFFGFYYFLIPTSNKNKLIYLFITQAPEGEIKTQIL